VSIPDPPSGATITPLPFLQWMKSQSYRLNDEMETNRNEAYMAMDIKREGTVDIYTDHDDHL
jgi:hypothetical protein